MLELGMLPSRSTFLNNKNFKNHISFSLKHSEICFHKLQYSVLSQSKTYWSMGNTGIQNQHPRAARIFHLLHQKMESVWKKHLYLLFVILRAPLSTLDFFFIFPVSHQGCGLTSLCWLTSCWGCFLSQGPWLRNPQLWSVSVSRKPKLKQHQFCHVLVQRQPDSSESSLLVSYVLTYPKT